MKKCFCLCLVLSVNALLAPRASGQVPVTPTPTPAVQPQQPRLTKFDLDFRGGTPVELVAEIEKASGRPLNAIVPVEYATRRLPPLKMKNVNAAELFQALQSSSEMRAMVQYGNSFQSIQTRYGFRNAGNRLVDDDTVWSFYVEGDLNLPRVTRFYLLTPYLDAGLKVDDITTAIQTGWRMRGDAPTPTLSFHKETKLLIAVGDSLGMDIIGEVLKALDGGKVVATPGPGDKPAEQKKTKQ